MSEFIHPNWLIRNKIGEHLFHEVASVLPVIDYHNHINPGLLAANRNFENLTDVWISEDPYKHRAMRIAGIPEAGITGVSTAKEKFDKWAQTLPKTLGNPLYHWSALELKRVFGIDELLTPSNADKIWNQCNELLQKARFSPSGIVEGYGTEMLVTSDDLLDELKSHQELELSQRSFKVLPSLRADSILDFNNPIFREWITSLSAKTSVSIHSLEDFQGAISQRLDFFNENGCIFSDHAVDSGFRFFPTDQSEAAGLFNSLLTGDLLEPKSLLKLRSCLMHFLGLEYARRGWIMQLHIGAQRQTSVRLRHLAGAAGGFASIGKACDINSIALFLNGMEQVGLLPETILYTLNPADNAALASLTGSFAEDGVVGKIQFGPAWWYNDHYAGIRKHLNDISAYGLLSTFIGMTTDSRSILSLSRHEYFRRILCDQIGAWVGEGKLPDDRELLTQLIADISYNNIKNRVQNRKTIWQS
jgi:glucuronate isomerase